MSSEPPFSRIAIVGLGLIGGSVALAAKQRWPGCRVTGIDRPEVLEQAVARRAVDAGAADISRLDRADLVVLAAPVGQNVALLLQVAASSSIHAVVTDVGGTKRPIVDAARALHPEVTFVGGHPLGGSEKGGLEFARPDLFSQRPWILTPHGSANGEAVERLARFVSALGATPTTMTAEEHDRLMALVSHLPQLAASALMDVIGSGAGAEGLRLAGQGLIDTTRLASSSATVWRDVCASNADAIGPALDLLIERLRHVRAGLEHGETVDGLFDEARRWRSMLVKGRE